MKQKNYRFRGLCLYGIADFLYFSVLVACQHDTAPVGVIGVNVYTSLLVYPCFKSK